MMRISTRKVSKTKMRNKNQIAPGALVINCIKNTSAPKLLSETLSRHLRKKTCFSQVSRKQDLWKTLSKWMEFDSAKYPVVVFNCHGERSAIEVGGRLIKIKEILSFLDGGGAGSSFHFSSCSTLKMSGAELRELRQIGGLLSLSGYLDSIGYLNSLACDLIFLEHLLTTPLSQQGLIQMMDGH